MALTLAELAKACQYRLNDLGAHDYDVEELFHAIDAAVHRAMALGRSHKAPKIITMVQDQPTYDIDPIHTVLEVGGLDQTTPRELGIITPAWAAAASSTPEKWLQQSASLLRVYPPPNLGAVGTQYTVWGFADRVPLTDGTDEITEVASAFARTTIVEDAVRILLRMRPTHGFNLQLANDIAREVAATYSAIEGAAKGRV